MFAEIGGFMTETREIEFTIPGIPVAKGRPKFSTHGGFIKAYTPAKTRNAENFVRKCFMEQIKDFKIPNKGPIVLSISFYMPIPKSLSKKAKKILAEQNTHHIKKPDLDNLIKLVNDALNGVAWEDDGCIAYTQAAKYYSAIPSTFVRIVYL